MLKHSRVVVALLATFAFLFASLSPASAAGNQEPRNLTVSGVSSSGFTLSWDQPDDPAGVTGYNVKADALPHAGDPTTLVATTDASTRSWSPTGLPAATCYTIQVFTVVNGAEVAENYPYQVCTNADYTVKNLRLQSVSISGGVLAWDYPVSPVNSFYIYRGTRLDGSGGWHHATSADNLQTISGLTAGQCTLVSVAAFVDGVVQPRSAGFQICGGS